MVGSFSTSAFGNNDPEDVAFDTDTGDIFTTDGAGREVYHVSSGGNGVFDGVPPAGDDIVAHFDTAVYGSMGSEGLAYDSDRNTLLIADPKTKRLFETTTAGVLLNTIDLSVANVRHAEDVVLAPSLANPSQMNMYVVARGVDNNGNPNENDGKMHELSASLPPMGNQAPQVDAGPDQMITLPDGATLAGSISDDGLPEGAPVTSLWTQSAGPGTVVFTDAGSPTTTVSFSDSGTYVLRLTADDTDLQAFDEVTITVNAEGFTVVDIPIALGADDAEESATGMVDRGNGDLELALDATPQTVGLRFLNVPIPQGATVLNAYVQFQADEKHSSDVTLMVQGHAVAAAPKFTTAAFDISSRPRTTAAVTWSPDPWTQVGERGQSQRTTDLSSVIQEIIQLQGWDGGPIVLIITGDGIGNRTAEAFNAGAALAPTLHVEYTSN
jgi:PKD domain